MMGIGFQALEEVLAEQFKKKGDAVVAENVGIARAGYDYGVANFKPFAWPLPRRENRYAVLSGNVAMAMGGAAAGVKFYCAYPMSPSTGALHWMSTHARKAGSMVRQGADEPGGGAIARAAAHHRRATLAGSIWHRGPATPVAVRCARPPAAGLPGCAKAPPCPP